jgi:uncharacterized membrane protein YbhN (UPF0104 family)
LTIDRTHIEYNHLLEKYVLRNRLVYIALSAIVSLVLLFLLVSQIRTADIVATLSHIYMPALFAYMVVALLGAWLRSWRYKWLLQPQPITWGNILLVTFIRNSLIDLLPARLGSLSFIYVLNRRLGFAFETATSTFVVAFVLDFLTLSPFLITAVLAVGLGSDRISGPALLSISLAFFGLIFLALWKIVPLARVLLAVYRRILRLFAAGEKKFARVSLDKFELTVQILSLIRGRRVFFPVFLLSLSIRLAKYVSVYLLFFGLLRSHGFSFSSLSFWVFILGISGAELTSALPVKGLAGFGTWESAWALTFRLMRFDARLAVLSGIGVHLLTNVYEYALGIGSILVLAWPYFRKRRGKNDRV